MSVKETDIMGYWDCNICGTKKIKGTLRECPNCGQPRDKNVRFYMSGPDIELTEEEKKEKGKGADWLCKCCGSYNSILDDTCTSCGAERTNDDYFSVKEKEEEKKAEKLVEEQAIEQSVETNTLQTMIGKYGKAALAVICGIFAIIAVVFACSPKTSTWTITDKYWNSYVDVEQNTYVAENDWVLPTGADLNDTRQEIHHYDKVADGTTEEEYESYEQVGSHTETRTSYSDNGDGTFHSTTYTEEVPDYGYVTRTRTVTKYKDVPVYKTKYYYHIWRWKYQQTLEETEHGNVDVHYGTKELTDKERYTNKRVKYYIEYNVKGKEKTKSIGEGNYKKLDIDHVYKVKTQLGKIKEIKEISKK